MFGIPSYTFVVDSQRSAQHRSTGLSPEEPAVAAHERYIKHIREDFLQWPVWEPNALVEIGTVGRFNGPIFKADRHLSGWGVSLRTKAKSAWSPLRYVSEAKTDLQTKAAATLNPKFRFLGQADAGVDVELSGGGSALLVAEKHRDVTLANLDEVCAAIRGLIRDGRWHPERCVVTSCKVAKNLQAIVAKQGGGHIELRSEVSLPTPLTDLGAVTGRLTVAGVSTSLTQYDMTYATPMFGDPIRVKRRLWDHFGRWYLVDPTGERFRVNFPSGFEDGEGDYRLEWEGDVSSEGEDALHRLSNAEFFERMDEQILESDQVLESEQADLVRATRSGLSYDKEIFRRQRQRHTFTRQISGFGELVVKPDEVGTYQVSTDE